MRTKAHARAPLAYSSFVAAGPRRLVITVVTVIAGVSAIMAALRLSSDASLRADLLDLITIPAAAPHPLALLTMGVALMVGVATLLLCRRAR